MRLTRLALDNFEGYEHTDLDLTDVTSLAVVGENGAGKSALLDALTWCLFDRSRLPGGGEGSSLDKLIRVGTDRCSVTVEWTSDVHHLSVTRSWERGGPGMRSLTVDGARQTAHTDKETRERIAAAIGMSYAALTAGPIMVQTGQYTTATGLMQVEPSARKEILMGAVADAAVYGPLYERANKALTEHDTLRRTAEVRITELDEQLRHSGLLEPQMAEAERVLAGAEAAAGMAIEEHASARETLATMTARASQYTDLRRRVDSLALLINEDHTALEKASERRANAQRYLEQTPVPEAPEPELVAAAADRVRAARTAREAVLTAQGTHDTLRSQLDREERQAAERENLLGKVPCHGEGIYATCPLLTSAAGNGTLKELHAAVAQAKAVLDEFEPAAADLTNAQLAEDHLQIALQQVGRVIGQRQLAEAAIQESSEQIDSLKVKIDRATHELDEAARLRDEVAAESEQRTEQERLTTRLLLAAQTAKDSVAKARVPLEALQRQAAVIERARVELDQWKARSTDASGQAETYRLLAAAFHRDGIPTLLIETAVPIIEAHANEVLARLPGALAISMSVGGEGASDRLTVTVTSAGAELDFYMLSIGQRFRVDLALRVALSRLLAARSGTRVETLWLDEPLAHVDAPGRQAVVEALGAIEDEFGLIVVVSHHDEFNEAFPTRLQVTQEGGISRAEIA